MEFIELLVPLIHPRMVLQLLIWTSYLGRLPEAICCCLQTYTVNDVLLVMYCMCLPAFFVPSADKSQLWVYSNILPVAICCCLDTYNVYVLLLTLFCVIVQKRSWSLVVTLGTFSLILNLLPEAICYCLQTC